MRTTLTLDDDLARRAAELAHSSRRPFNIVVNEALRRGLAEVAPPEPKFDFLPHAGHLRPEIAGRSFNELAWEENF